MRDRWEITEHSGKLAYAAQHPAMLALRTESHHSYSFLDNYIKFYPLEDFSLPFLHFSGQSNV